MRQPLLFVFVFIIGFYCLPFLLAGVFVTQNRAISQQSNQAGMLTRKVGTGAPDELVRLPDLMVLTICPSSE